MRLHTLLEANVEPKGLDYIEKFIHEIGEELEASNPGINHGAFLTRLRKDIINNNRIIGANVTITALVPYKPKKTDPDFIKNATEEVYTVNHKALKFLYNDLLDLFIPDEGEPTSHAMFNQFHNLVKDADTLDPNIANKLLPIKKKYEQGKFDFSGLKQAMQVITQLGAQKWKYDKVERQRIEKDAPIIMKFDNGIKWVRLDSKEEMAREGEMMQNCLSQYCPIQSVKDIIGDWYRQWEDADFVAHDDIEEMMEWLTDQVEPDAQETADELDLDIWNMAEMLIDRYEHNKEYGVDQPDAYAGHLIYSLRDKNGESHVSAEYDPQEDMNHIEPLEVLGKQNVEAVGKYKPYIEKLNNFFEEYPETFGHDGATMDEPRHPNYYGTDLSANESIINRMKPSVRQTILEAKSAQYLYHATFTKNVSNILNKGLLQFQPSLWIKGPGGSRYNEEAGIFAFDNPKDALNWASKMRWEFRDDDKDISIVRIDMEEFWGDDPAEDPFIAQHGRSMRSAQNIKADKIIDAIKLDDLGKPGDLDISRDEWLDQSSKVLGEGLWDDIKNKVRIYNPEFKVGWDSKGDPTANLVWRGKFDKDFRRYDKGDWVNPNKKKSVNPDKKVTEATKEKLTLAKLPYAKNALAPVKQMAAIHANEDVEYDHHENTYPEIEFVCANDEYCDATDPEAQNALWNDLRSVKGIVSYKQDWSHDDPVGNPVSMAVIIKEPEALDIIRGLAGKHGVEIDLDSIEHRNEKYLDTLASGETPYVVDVMFHEDTNKQLRNIGQHMQNKAWLSAQDRVGPGDQDMAVGAEERFNRGMGGMMKKIGSGKLDSITNKELANTKTASTDYAAELRSRLNRIKKVGEDAAGVGIITKQNTTADVKKGETKRQAAKFRNKFPPSEHK